ncbi:MAG: biopolymer transporter ExbD [Thermoguttaceae bacterium]
MAGKLSQQIKAEPNLTPILDMVFQLITFFMLVINFKSAEIDFSLKLPVVGSARPVDSGGHIGLLVLNIDSKGNLRTSRSVTDIDNFLKIQAQATMLAARLTPDDLEHGIELPTTVVIRADRDTPFGKVNRVIKACQDNGFRSFALKARVNKDG